MILSILWRIWVYTNMAFWLIIIGPLVYVSTFFSSFYYTNLLIRLWSICVFYGAGFRYSLNENSLQLNPNKQYIFISNHTSIMDIPLMYLLHKEHALAFVGKKSLVKIPIFGAVYKRVCVMVDRESQKSKSRVYELTHEKIKQGRNVVIFPEGGVPDDTTIVLDEFKDGAFSIAITGKIPIVVYTFIGLKEGFPFQFQKGKPLRVHVRREIILETTNLTIDSRKELKDTARNRMLERLTT